MACYVYPMCNAKLLLPPWGHPQEHSCSLLEPEDYTSISQFKSLRVNHNMRDALTDKHKFDDRGKLLLGLKYMTNFYGYM